MRTRTAVKALVSTGMVVALGAGGAVLASTTAGSAQGGAGWKQVRAATTAAATAEPDITAPEKIVVIEHDIKFKVVEVDGSFGTGARFLFQANLNDPTDTTKVGTLYVDCTALFNAFQCDGTAVIYGRGKITFSGASSSENKFLLAVTGGTGEFANVRGQLQVTTIDDSTDKLVFHLLP